MHLSRGHVVVCAPVTDRDLECVMKPLKNLLRVKKHERGNKTSRTPCSTLTVTIHDTTGVDLSRYQLRAFSRNNNEKCYDCSISLWVDTGLGAFQNKKNKYKGE